MESTYCFSCFPKSPSCTNAFLHCANTQISSLDILPCFRNTKFFGVVNGISIRQISRNWVLPITTHYCGASNLECTWRGPYRDFPAGRREGDKESLVWFILHTVIHFLWVSKKPPRPNAWNLTDTLVMQPTHQTGTSLGQSQVFLEYHHILLNMSPWEEWFYEWNR